MKALSGYAEYFWLMAKNIKPIENRSWPITRYFKINELPVRVYLHGSKTPAGKDDISFIRRKLYPEQLREFDSINWSQYRGAIIGEVTITRQVTLVESGILADDEGLLAVYSGWFFGVFGFVVKDGKLYEKPVPCSGQLGFFEVSIGAK